MRQGEISSGAPDSLKNADLVAFHAPRVDLPGNSAGACDEFHAGAGMTRPPVILPAHFQDSLPATA